MNRKRKITEADFKQLENLNSIPQKEILTRLGIGIQYEYSPSKMSFNAPYFEIGLKFWKSLKVEFYEVICDEKNSKPKEWVNDLIVGDIRNLAIGIISAITSRYNVSLAIAIPSAALIIKTGILKYCDISNKKVIKKSVSDLLAKKKNAMQELKRKRMMLLKVSKKSLQQKKAR